MGSHQSHSRAPAREGKDVTNKRDFPRPAHEGLAGVPGSKIERGTKPATRGWFVP